MDENEHKDNREALERDLEERAGGRDFDELGEMAAVGIACFAVPFVLRVWASTGYTWWELAVWVLLSAALGGAYSALRTD